MRAMHITASVFINDDESGLHSDFEVSWKNWHRRSLAVSMHNGYEDNADAQTNHHGKEVVVAITMGGWTSARGSKSLWRIRQEKIERVLVKL